ncbi:integrin alpha-D-like isoform X1 [Clavelina lepadiformis]|uniref:integrin alpha-D-like isoform X1 n=1 Tax=Clavelina lepadiformis TaxID=159417 RepID=UPI004042BFCD
MAKLINRKRFFYLICLLLSIITLICDNITYGFNIEPLPSTSINNPNNYSVWNSSNYFGYSLALRRSVNGIVRAVIGSPKERQPITGYQGFAPTIKPQATERSGPGAIYNCPFSFPSVSPSCTRTSPLKLTNDSKIIEDRESLGLSLSLQSGTDVVTVCAPLRMRECTYSYLTHGTCGNSNNFGETWATNPQGGISTTKCQTLDLIFLIDGSGSVNEKDQGNFNRVKEWVKTVTSSFDISSSTDVGVIQYSHAFRNRSLDMQPYITTEVSLGKYHTLTAFNEAVDNISYHSFTTFTAHAINKTVLDFMSGSRYSDKSNQKVMILLTDGRSSDSQDLAASAAYARSLGITIFAVGVADFVREELEIITGSNDRIFTQSDYDQLNQVVGSLQLSISGVLEGGAKKNSSNLLRQSETGFATAMSEVSEKALSWFVWMCSYESMGYSLHC